MYSREKIRFGSVNHMNFFLLSYQSQMNMHDNFDPNEFLIDMAVKQATNQPIDILERDFNC
jgi:hypothetical protein